MLTLHNLGAPAQLLSFLSDATPAAVATPAPELRGPRHVLLLTDIGRDIDDTVALMALLGAAPHLALCGVVTCGGCGKARQTLAQCWLHALGARGVPVVAGADEASIEAAHCHVAFTSEQQAEASRAGGRTVQCGESAPAFIVRMARQFKKRLLIVAIGPMGPVQAALELPGGTQALRHIGGLFIQGQSLVGSGETRLRPSAEAFNLREDMAAAEAIFDQAAPCPIQTIESGSSAAFGTSAWYCGDRLAGAACLAADACHFILPFPPPIPLTLPAWQLQDYIPFTLLGKHAAYRNGIKCADFDSWSAVLRERVQTGLKPDSAFREVPHLGNMARSQMDQFRRAAPAAYYGIYKVPPEYRNDEEWHQHLPADVLCTPYDPLLVLACVRPELFEPERAGTALQHRLIGNTAEQHGVPDPAATHGALGALVGRALVR